MKTELVSGCWGAAGEADDIGAAGATGAASAGGETAGEEKRSKLSFALLGGAAGDLVDPMVAPIKSRLLPDETDCVRDC